MVEAEASEQVGQPEGDLGEPVARDYRRPGWISRFAQFDSGQAEGLFRQLGAEWDSKRGPELVRAHHRRRRATAVFYVAVVAIAVAAVLAVRNEVQIEAHSKGLPVGAQVVYFASGLAAVALPCAVVLLAYLRSVDAARSRFLRRIGMAIEHIWAADHDKSADLDVVRAMNDVGAAARALFLSLQRSRRTWRSPPAVADRAVRLAAPLLDIELPNDVEAKGDDKQAPRTLLHNFLQDVAIVVAMARPDLIPRVRGTYPNLPPRSSGPNAAIAVERDAAYLNPMHARTRWEVVKDFVLPLASWLGAAVSLFVAIRGWR